MDIPEGWATPACLAFKAKQFSIIQLDFLSPERLTSALSLFTMLALLGPLLAAQVYHLSATPTYYFTLRAEVETQGFTTSITGYVDQHTF